MREEEGERVRGRVNQLIVRVDGQMSVITTCFHLSVAQNGLIFSSAVDKWEVNGKYSLPVGLLNDHNSPGKQASLKSPSATQSGLVMGCGQWIYPSREWGEI